VDGLLKILEEVTLSQGTTMCDSPRLANFESAETNV